MPAVQCSVAVGLPRLAGFAVVVVPSGAAVEGSCCHIAWSRPCCPVAAVLPRLPSVVLVRGWHAAGLLRGGCATEWGLRCCHVAAVVAVVLPRLLSCRCRCCLAAPLLLLLACRCVCRAVSALWCSLVDRGLVVGCSCGSGPVAPGLVGWGMCTAAPGLGRVLWGLPPSLGRCSVAASLGGFLAAGWCCGPGFLWAWVAGVCLLRCLLLCLVPGLGALPLGQGGGLGPLAPLGGAAVLGVRFGSRAESGRVFDRHAGLWLGWAGVPFTMCASGAVGGGSACDFTVAGLLWLCPVPLGLLGCSGCLAACFCWLPCCGIFVRPGLRVTGLCSWWPCRLAGLGVLVAVLCSWCLVGRGLWTAFRARRDFARVCVRFSCACCASRLTPRAPFGVGRPCCGRLARLASLPFCNPESSRSRGAGLGRYLHQPASGWVAVAAPRSWRWPCVAANRSVWAGVCRVCGPLPGASVPGGGGSLLPGTWTLGTRAALHSCGWRATRTLPAGGVGPEAPPGDGHGCVTFLGTEFPCRSSIGGGPGRAAGLLGPDAWAVEVLCLPAVRWDTRCRLARRLSDPCAASGCCGLRPVAYARLTQSACMLCIVPFCSCGGTSWSRYLYITVSFGKGGEDAWGEWHTVGIGKISNGYEMYEWVRNV